MESFSVDGLKRFELLYDVVEELCLKVVFSVVVVVIVVRVVIVLVVVWFEDWPIFKEEEDSCWDELRNDLFIFD